MKKLLLAILLIAFSGNAQQKETVDLQWKIADTLTFETVMKDEFLENSNEEMGNDSIFDGMFGMFRAMQGELSDLKYETKLFPDKNGNVDIVMMLGKEEQDTAETLLSAMSMMNGNVVLRGKLSPEGELLSFYYNRDQNNLVSILFELPSQPIQIGDEWDLNVNMISMDQNFIADTLFKQNTVRLKDVVIKNGNQIAIIEYGLQEYVAGGFGDGIMSRFFQGEDDKKIYMKISHKAIAEFDIEQGSWFSYNGTREMETNFVLMGMGGNKKTEFKLTPQK